MPGVTPEAPRQPGHVKRARRAAVNRHGASESVALQKPEHQPAKRCGISVRKSVVVGPNLKPTRMLVLRKKQRHTSRVSGSICGNNAAPDPF